MHTDLSGIKRINNNRGVRYYVTFTDDFSRFRVIYLLKKKSDVDIAYQEYKTWIEEQTGYQIKALRSDNGTEFKNARMYKLLKGAGPQYTIPGNPESNGVSERGMGVIDSYVSTMLEASGIKSYYWPECVLYHVHLKNRLPCASIGHQIPYEVLFKKPVDFNRLHTFG